MPLALLAPWYPAPSLSRLTIVPLLPILNAGSSAGRRLRYHIPTAADGRCEHRVLTSQPGVAEPPQEARRCHECHCHHQRSAA